MADVMQRKFGNWMEQLLLDVRFGARMLFRNPAFSLVLVLTLALGIGLNTAVFSVVNAVMIRPLPYPHPERLLWLSEYNPILKADIVPGVDFLDWQAQAKSFEEMVAYDYLQPTLVTADRAEPQWLAQVTANFWNFSGARPALGRLFTTQDRAALVLSDGLFERRFGRDPRVIGSVVNLGGHPVTILGVLPRGFRFVLPQDLFGIELAGPRVEEHRRLPTESDCARQRVSKWADDDSTGCRAIKARCVPAKCSSRNGRNTRAHRPRPCGRPLEFAQDPRDAGA